MSLTRSSAVALVVTLLLSSQPGVAADQEKAAQAAAEAWLQLTDTGKYPESWDAAAKLFQGAVPKDKWSEALDSVRKPLGALKSRKLKSARATKSPSANAPEADYVVLQFETSFESKKGMIETITPMLEKDRGWRVSGYFIK